MAKRASIDLSASVCGCRGRWRFDWYCRSIDDHKDRSGAKYPVREKGVRSGKTVGISEVRRRDVVLAVNEVQGIRDAEGKRSDTVLGTQQEQ